ncbi:hypothetical protein CDAR_57841 [Caerostris darwini]|uniref:Uncharacterized protein n=1 Tax=Caerostris darwini TaxID=1538125 RepID=A0AAV4T0B2_9ARAC|nr:hypothetical protein CDAR_57841 [Caerostris darwini]
MATGAQLPPGSLAMQINLAQRAPPSVAFVKLKFAREGEAAGEAGKGVRRCFSKTVSFALSEKLRHRCKVLNALAVHNRAPYPLPYFSSINYCLPTLKINAAQKLLHYLKEKNNN